MTVTFLYTSLSSVFIHFPFPFPFSPKSLHVPFLFSKLNLPLFLRSLNLEVPHLSSSDGPPPPFLAPMSAHYPNTSHPQPGPSATQPPIIVPYRYRDGARTSLVSGFEAVATEETGADANKQATGVKVVILVTGI